jgi:hypothetical protein
MPCCRSVPQHRRQRFRRHETLERRDIAAEVRLTGGGSGGLGIRANHLLTTTQDSPNHVSCGPPLEFVVTHLAWKKSGVGSVSMKRQPAAPYFRSMRPRMEFFIMENEHLPKLKACLIGVCDGSSDQSQRHRARWLAAGRYLRPIGSDRIVLAWELAS